jgi:HEAT repeat protein
LRFKAQLGDKEAEVTGECFAALLALASTASLPFVARFLYSGSAPVQEAAVFALAESRRPEAFAALKDFWPRAPADLREAVLLAISMLRLPAALDFLTALIAGKDQNSLAALSALAIHRHHGKTRESVAAAVRTNGEAGVQQWFLKKFPDAPA